jgi:hypothetical protein
MITKEQALINVNKKILDQNYDLKAQCEGYRKIVKRLEVKIKSLKKARKK